MILLSLLFEGLLACAAAVAAAGTAAVAAAFGEGAAEAASCGDAGAGGVTVTGCGSVTASADYAAEAEAAPSPVIVAVRNDDGEEAAVAVGALLRGGLVGAEAVVDYVILLVDAALHLGFAAAGEERECGRGKEWSGDLG
jgi:hypothetical protein